MTNSLGKAEVRGVLDRLFAAADGDVDALPWPAGRPFAGAPVRERGDAMAGVYMPISAAGGNLLYALIRAIRPDTVVEFGMSFGISTIYLAAAVVDNRVGRVVTTESSESKIAAARENLREAGVGDVVTILEGDAMETLEEVAGPIGLVLLDGWKDLYVPVLKMLEPRLATGALVVADDTQMTNLRDYLKYVREPANGYVTVAFPVEDNMEISCYTGGSAGERLR